MKCQACNTDKGPGWPHYLDFSQPSNQNPCGWCQDSKLLTPEVESVYQRLLSDPGILNNRANFLASEALIATEAWDRIKNQKKPRNLSGPEWSEIQTKAQQRAKQSVINSEKAIQAWKELQKDK